MIPHDKPRHRRSSFLRSRTAAALALSLMLTGGGAVMATTAASAVDFLPTTGGLPTTNYDNASGNYGKKVSVGDTIKITNDSYDEFNKDPSVRVGIRWQVREQGSSENGPFIQEGDDTNTSYTVRAQDAGLEVYAYLYAERVNSSGTVIASASTSTQFFDVNGTPGLRKKDGYPSTAPAVEGAPYWSWKGSTATNPTGFLYPSLPDAYTPYYSAHAGYLGGPDTYVWHRVKDGVDTVVQTNKVTAANNDSRTNQWYYPTQADEGAQFYVISTWNSTSSKTYNPDTYSVKSALSKPIAHDPNESATPPTADKDIHFVTEPGIFGSAETGGTLNLANLGTDPWYKSESITWTFHRTVNGVEQVTTIAGADGKDSIVVPEEAAPDADGSYVVSARVVATANDGTVIERTADSAPIRKGIDPRAPKATTDPQFTGDSTFAVNGTAKVTVDGWSGDPEYTYAWYRVKTGVQPEVVGTESSYTFTKADEGARFGVLVTGTNAYGSAVAEVDSPVIAGAESTLPSITVTEEPKLLGQDADNSGDVTVGEKVKAEGGTYSVPSPKVTYQWYTTDADLAAEQKADPDAKVTAQAAVNVEDALTPIDGATSAEYTARASDATHTLVVRVTAAQSGYQSAVSYLVTDAPVRAAAPGATPPGDDDPAVTTPIASKPVPAKDPASVKALKDPKGSLAYTGFDAAPVAMGGVAALALGLLLMLVNRRRKGGAHTEA